MKDFTTAGPMEGPRIHVKPDDVGDGYWRLGPSNYLEKYDECRWENEPNSSFRPIVHAQGKPTDYPGLVFRRKATWANLGDQLAQLEPDPPVKESLTTDAASFEQAAYALLATVATFLAVMDAEVEPGAEDHYDGILFGALTNMRRAAVAADVARGKA